MNLVISRASDRFVMEEFLFQTSFRFRFNFEFELCYKSISANYNSREIKKYDIELAATLVISKTVGRLEIDLKFKGIYFNSFYKGLRINCVK